MTVKYNNSNSKQQKFQYLAETSFRQDLFGKTYHVKSGVC